MRRDLVDIFTSVIQGFILGPASFIITASDLKGNDHVADDTYYTSTSGQHIHL